MKPERNVILYIAASLDGYIAGPGDDLSFLSIVQQDDEDYGYSDFIKTVDTVIMGRRTYDWVLKETGSYPHKDLISYIITRTPQQDTENIKFYSGELKDLIQILTTKKGSDIFVEGGAEIVNELLNANLIDTLIISIIPVLLGDGIRLFKDGRPEKRLKLIGSRKFRSGLVQLLYVTSDNS